MKTYQPSSKSVTRKWHLIDAQGKVLGRLASEIAGLLISKYKIDYAPHIDIGDYVVVINAQDIEVTGKKRKQKVYKKHTNYPGGLKEVKFEKLEKNQPKKIIMHAVSGMLPKNRLQKVRMNRLKIYRGEKHPYPDKFKRLLTN